MYVGDVKVWTPTVTGSDSTSVPPGGYDLSFTNNHPERVQVVLDPVVDSTAKTATITALAAGAATITWTATPKGPYTGTAASAAADTVTVSAARTISSLTGAYV